MTTKTAIIGWRRHARRALKAFGLKDIKSAEMIEEKAIDLIADLLHLARSKGLNTKSIIRQAVAHYEHETRNPDEEV